MKKYFYLCSLLITIFACVGCQTIRPISTPNCYSSSPSENQKNKLWKTECISVNGVKLRAGLFQPKKEKSTDKPKANVLYLEGLADSMFNHDQLINTIAEARYRVISFDYPGQGGSDGTMSQTRIMETVPQRRLITDWFKQHHKHHDDYNDVLEKITHKKPSNSGSILIEDMAKKVWNQLKKSNNIPEDEQINAVIGWSTGGLAAFEMAAIKPTEQGLKAVVLIVPGTNIKPVSKIRAKNLNSNEDFEHVDGIWPISPLLIPGFAVNLFGSGLASQNWTVDKKINGLVLLSGQEKDKFVDSEKVERTVRNSASHFKFVNYPDAAHEIDNETVENRTANKVILEQRVVQFLNKIFP